MLKGAAMTGHIDPTRESFEVFKALPRDEPLEMLNLIRLRDKAAYPDGRAATGLEAYTAYGEHSAPIFQRVGGSILWRGAPRSVLIGPGDEAWDLSFIAAYPSAGAFLEMVTDPDYQSRAVPHRQAAVLDSRLIRHAPLPGGSAFG
jgi:uncharacterized protein (DUF1330 family)